jgi:hypothetical protein
VASVLAGFTLEMSFSPSLLAPQQISSSLGASAEVQECQCVCGKSFISLYCVHCKTERVRTFFVNVGTCRV